MADSDRARLMASFDFATPALQEEFPFPHRVEIEVRLSGGTPEVHTTVHTIGSRPVPIAFGFHPYLQIPGVPRGRWEVSFPVRRRLRVDARLIPTGGDRTRRPRCDPRSLR